MRGSADSERPWSFEEAVASLKAATRFGIHPSLESIRAICRALGDPFTAYECAQVAGTNGKGSTARFLEAMLRAEGRDTGLYTSPDLQGYPERIEIGGEVVSDADFALAVGVAADTARALFKDGGADKGSPVTEFELLTAAALWLFAARQVDTAVLEVGMGGRWDATSVVRPKAAVITGVGLDHTSVLGDTLEKIAAEKAAIIVAGAAAVLGPGTADTEGVFLERASEVGARVIAVRELGAESPVAAADTVRYAVERRPGAPGGTLHVTVEGLLGRYEGLEVRAPGYQAPNLATAVAAAEATLGRALDDDAVRAALAACRLPGRFELLRERPPVVIDGAHNPQAAAVLASAIEEAWPDPAARPVLLLGVLADKDAAGIVAALAPAAASIAVTASSSPRALAPDALAGIVEAASGTRPRTFATVADALDALVGESPGGLVVAGSITVAGEARSILARPQRYG